MNEEKILWVDKYKPRKLSELVLSDNIKKYFSSMIKTKNILNCTFSGPAGIGKSTICNVIANEIKAEKMFIPCAVEGNVATAQGKLKTFCDSMTFDGNLKIVILDEVDASSATQDSSFQKSLRNLIEAAQEDTRFLLNCNYIEKVLQPIKSRCPVINLKFEKKDLLKRIKFILDEEKIEYTKETLKQFIEESFKFYPDIRRIISYLQGSCTTGKLIITFETSSNSDKDSLISNIVNKCLNEKNILDVRKYYLTCKEKISDYIEFGSLLFNYVVDNNIVESPEAILKLSDILYQINIVVDKECSLFAMLVAIKQYGKL